MDLREYFENGLTVAAYTDLLDEDQKDLHELYERRADIDPQAVETIRAAGPHGVLVVTETWCGDSLAIFPVVVKLFAEVGFEVRIVRRDEHPELIDRYLTDGGRAIPIVILLDTEYCEQFHWGPRPKTAQDIVIGSKEDIAAGRVQRADVHKKVRTFYARDHGKSVVKEFAEAFS